MRRRMRHARALTAVLLATAAVQACTDTSAGYEEPDRQARRQ